MHRPRHAHTIFSAQMAALLLCVNRVVIIATMGMLVASMLTANVGWMIRALVLAGSAVVITIIQWIFASSAKCPLCMMPFLSSKGCSRHRHARSFAGSHRFPVALGVLFKGRFRCPYCNEPTLLELKGR